MGPEYTRIQVNRYIGVSVSTCLPIYISTVLQMFWRESFGQKLSNSHFFDDTTRPICHENYRIESKFRHHLTASTARRATIVSDNGDHLEFPLPLRDSFENGNPLGTHRLGISSILHIDTGKYLSGLCAE